MPRAPFNPQSVRPKSRYTTGVYAFKGVDYASQRFSVAQGRAIDLLNFIYKDGVAQVRKGYVTIIKFKAERYLDAIDGTQKTNDDLTIYGLWEFVDRYGNKHVMAHVGSLLYEVIGIDTEKPAVSMITSPKGAYPLVRKKINAFVGDYSLYILGGIKYLKLEYTQLGTYTITPVEELETTFIPTTTISITEDNSEVGARQSYDGVNLMTQWRYNRCHTGSKTTSQKEFSYTLDAPIVCKNEEEADMANFQIKVRKKGTKSL